MKKFVFWMLLAFLLSACSLLDVLFSTEKENHLINSEIGDLKEEQVLGVAWDALEPNTSSHDLGNWDVVEVSQVAGRQVAERFEGEPAPGCWSGPEPPGNGAIRAGQTGSRVPCDVVVTRTKPSYQKDLERRVAFDRPHKNDFGHLKILRCAELPAGNGSEIASNSKR